MTADRLSPIPPPDDAGPRCDACKGRGWVHHDDVPRAVCATCNGTGYPKSWAAEEIARLDAEVARLRARAEPSAATTDPRVARFAEAEKAAAGIGVFMAPAHPPGVACAWHEGYVDGKRDAEAATQRAACPYEPRCSMGSQSCAECVYRHAPATDARPPDLAEIERLAKALKERAYDLGAIRYDPRERGRDTEPDRKRVDSALAALLDAIRRLAPPPPAAPKGTPDADEKREAYIAAVERVVKALASGERPKCRTCERPAVCVGAYEESENLDFACDECCGHGNEDGWCVPLAAAAPKGTDPRDAVIAALFRACPFKPGEGCRRCRVCDAAEQVARLSPSASSATGGES